MRSMRYDHQLLAALRRFGADPAVAGTAKGLSAAGEHGAVWIAAGLAGAGADRVRRRAWLRATALVAGSHLASIAVKRVVRRPRPQLPSDEPLVRTAGRHSFPSSHATSSAAAAIAFGTLLARGPLARAVPLVPPLAAGVCLSRLVVGVHYPTDVACGALLGGALARLGRGWTLAPAAEPVAAALPGPFPALAVPLAGGRHD
jgi:undecaprenyl-diphosphatase